MKDATPAAGFPAGFPKLRNVVIEKRHPRIEGEWIQGQLPESTDATGWWNPLRAYYLARSYKERPYRAFYNCGTDKESIKRFTEACGLISQTPGEGGRTASLSLAQFQFERWHFYFTVFLYGSMKDLDNLRRAFNGAVTEIEKNQSHPKAHLWKGVFHRIRDDIVRDGGLSLPAGFDDLRQHIKKASGARLVGAARAYTSRVVRERLDKTRLWLDYEEDGSARLSVLPSDLLTAFYFMLASDWGTGLAPVVCGYCGRIFPSERRNAAYCSRAECRRKGPLKTSWARHGADYVRTRKEKRRKARLQKI